MTDRSRSTAQWIRRSRRFDTVPDVADRRDRLYQPALISLRSKVEPWAENADWWDDRRVRNQGLESSCVGHALAAVVDHLLACSLIDEAERNTAAAAFDPPWVSWRMLYETARFHDEWAGENYKGSSIRGALKGFFYNGVCSVEEEDKLRRAQGVASGGDFRWYMTKAIAESARSIQLGAYYRVRPRLPDMHAALNEAHVLVASAYVHDGWHQPKDGRIPFDMGPVDNPVDNHDEWRPMHAFAVVGYTAEGFWIQNSWGPEWGIGGRALWAYEDWAANFCDAWVLRLGLLPARHADRSSVKITAYGGRIDRLETHFLGHERMEAAAGPSRLDVLGHMLPCREGRLDQYGPYNVNLKTLEETCNIIRDRMLEPGDAPAAKKRAGNAGRPAYRYEHVLLYFMGGWPNEGELAMQLAEIIPVFKRQGIYPLFIVWDAALFNELELLVRRIIETVRLQTEDTADRRRAVRDRLIERQLADPANRLLREVRRSARRMFASDRLDSGVEAPGTMDGADQNSADIAQEFMGSCLDRLFQTLDARYRNGSISYHLAAHGFGAQIVLEWLANPRQGDGRPNFETASLISPLISIERAKAYLLESVATRGEGRPNRRARSEHLSIARLDLYLLDRLALKLDRFSDDYGGAWPELWARVRALNIGTRPQSTQAWSGQGEVLRMLAIMDHARDLLSSAGANIRIFGVRAIEDEADSSLHHELGLNKEMLDRLVREILGLGGEEKLFFGRPSRRITIGAEG